MDLPKLKLLVPLGILIKLVNFLSTTTTMTHASPLIMWYYYCINTTGNYNEFSMYKSNLNTIISSIASTSPAQIPGGRGGFYNFTEGEGADRVNAIGLCRGDTTSDTCLSCLSDAVYKLPERCPTQKEAIGWYDDCMLRYSDRPIFHMMETNPSICLTNVYNFTDVDLLNRTRAGLLRTLTDQAVRPPSGSSSLVPYYATGQVNATGGSLTLYGMVQCTPDLTTSDCSNCLEAGMRKIPRCSYGNRGGRSLMPSCSVRYETAPFINISDSSPPASPNRSSSPPLPLLHGAPNATTTGNKSKTTKVVIVIVLSTFASLVLITSLFFLLRRRKSWKRYQTSEGDILTVESLQFDFGAIKVATDNFSLNNRLGQGGFGAVYKGILPDGQEIAVKRLASNNSGQGEAEFKNEILLMAKLQHRNLVRLLGFCLCKEERLLIYEFVPNASLDNFLFDPVRNVCLDWEKRSKIIGGISRGLVYLHEDSRLRIIHRDLKASNILLDAEMNPKIADFGLAKLFLADQTHADTSRIAGTYGYMAPEYAIHGKFSAKLDVYSFGILLLEIICGRRNSGYNSEGDAISIVPLVWMNWKEGTISNVIDPTLLGIDSSGSEIRRYIHISLLCVQENESERPTMSSVVLMLSTDSLSLPLPSNPAFVAITMPAAVNLSHQSYSISKATITLPR